MTDRDRQLSEALNARVSRETLERLELFEQLLLRWNSTINLVGRMSTGDLWRRHIVDSAQLVPLLPVNLSVAADIGSGAGFPGLIVALLSNIPFVLIESDQRKVAFLREASRITAAPVTVEAGSAADAKCPRSRLVTARACAALPQLLRLAFPLLTTGGACLFLKGAGVENELTAARREWHMRVERIPSRTAPDAMILRLSEINRVGSAA